MLTTNVRRIFRTGLLHCSRNPFVSLSAVAVMVVALAVIAGTAIAGGLLRTSLAAIEEKVDINVYLSTAATLEETNALKAAIESLPEVAQVELLSAEERLARFKERNAHDQRTIEVLDELEVNPLGPALLVKAKQPSQYAGVAKFLEQNYPVGASAVADVNYYRNKEVIDRLSNIIDAGDTLGATVAVALILVAVGVTLNTIRLAIYVSKDEISIMKLVGAEQSYIAGPFLVAGGIYGLSAAILTLVLAFPAAYYLAPATSRFFGESSSLDYLLANFGQVSLLVVGSGLLVGVGSSLIAVNRYLRGKA
jgi:cell division transport system permease protein